jgi:hypothetical protein
MIDAFRKTGSDKIRHYYLYINLLSTRLNKSNIPKRAIGLTKGSNGFQPVGNVTYK